jgi:hypothetical protein
MIDRDNDPVTLADAANHFRLSKGVLKADGLKGKLAMYKLGRQYYTTPNAVREWVEQCRVERRDRASISINREDNGSSVTERISSAQDALRRSLNELKSSSRNI